MKAILEIDVPEKCEECPCYNDDFVACQAVSDSKYKMKTIDYDTEGRASFCPLKLIDEK